MTRDDLLSITRCDVVRRHADEILAAIASGGDWTGPLIDLGITAGDPDASYVVRGGQLRRVVRHYTSEGFLTSGWHTEPLHTEPLDG